jgi:hypothetical protein epulo_10402
MENNNFFKEIQEKRKRFEEYAKKALNYQWITQEEYDEYLHKIENDKLTIGVIGQMKCGKSTFLNALIFEDEILPAATTPMTASLSVITYGAEKSLEAEFYTSDEWAELQVTANRSLDEVIGNTSEESKIKAAKELVSKAEKIGGNLSALLGTKRKDKLENLIEYVGADGKYIAITKSVRLEYPLEYLKGVEIVDTPGFNDPIVSREERTKEFLKKADVVVMLLYAGRAFDATDKDIIFNLVRNVGVGKVLIGVNKYDLCYERGETSEEIIEAVREQLKKASNEFAHNNSIGDLVRKAEPILLSANMALMSKIPLSKIQEDENLQFYYKRALDIFEISNQDQMYEKSLMQNFEDAIKEQVIKSKDEILIAKPKNRITQIGENKAGEVEIAIAKLKEDIEISTMSKEKAEEAQYNVEKAKKRAEKKINNFGAEIEDIVTPIIRNLRNEMEGNVITNRRKAVQKIRDLKDRVIFNYGIDNRIRNLDHDVKNIHEDAYIQNRNLYEEKTSQIVSEIKKASSNFIMDIEEICDKYLEDFEPKEYINKVNRYLASGKMPETDEQESSDSATQETSEINIIEGILTVALSPLLIAEDILGLGGNFDKDRSIAYIESVFDELLPKDISNSISEKVETMILNIKKLFLEEFLQPIDEKLQERMNESTENTQKAEEAEQKINNLLSQSKALKEQVVEMKMLAQNI